jgi:hypothetical protein
MQDRCPLLWAMMVGNGNSNLQQPTFFHDGKELYVESQNTAVNCDA